MLKTWLSPRDTIDLFSKSIDKEDIHNSVVYGVSANTGSMVDNSHIRELGWQPKDNGDVFSEKVSTLDHGLTEIGSLTHGGNYCGENNTDESYKFLKY